MFERDANTDGKWDIFTVTPDGKDETKVVDNASWGTWISNDEIVYARGTAIFRRKLGGRRGDRAGRQHEGARAGRRAPAAAGDVEGRQATSPSPCAARSARRGSGTSRKKTWTRTGEGCQINWSPTASEVYWVHPTGNGGSRVLHMPDQGRQGGQERRRHRCAHAHRHPGPPLARVLPAAVGRRQVAGVGGHPARARPRHRRLRDLPVGGGHAAREGGAADLPLGQRSLARHLHPGSGRPDVRGAARRSEAARPSSVAGAARRSRWSVRCASPCWARAASSARTWCRALAARPRTEIDAVDRDLDKLARGLRGRAAHRGATSPTPGLLDERHRRRRRGRVADRALQPRPLQHPAARRSSTRTSPTSCRS